MKGFSGRIAILMIATFMIAGTTSVQSVSATSPSATTTAFAARQRMMRLFAHVRLSHKAVLPTVKSIRLSRYMSIQSSSKKRSVSPSSRIAVIAPSMPLPVASTSSSSVSFSSRSSAVVSISMSADEAAVLKIVNEERAKAHLSPVTGNALLQKAAVNYASDMNSRNFFSHTDLEGRVPKDRIAATGYLTPPCSCSWQYWIGENIAKGQTTPQQVMHDWMNSPDHRDNILNEHFTQLGVGRVGNVWVQEFGDVSHD